MNTPLTLSAFLCAAAVGAAPLQQALTPVTGAAPQGQVAPDAFDLGAAALSLRADDLGARMEAYDRLLAEARKNPAVRDGVRAWADDASRRELAWTAQLMLRELDAAPAHGGLLGQLDDPFSGFGLGAPGAGGPALQDLMQRHDELMRRFDDLMGGVPQLDLQHLQGLPQGGGSSSSESFSLQQGPDGVKLELKEDVDGQEQVKTYEAESMEALLDAHPELKDKIGGGGFQLRLGAPQGFDPRDFDSPFGGLFGDAPRTDRLGVQVLDSTHFTRAVAGLDAGVGLEVVSVLPGSLGEALGLEVGDVVTTVNGRTVHGVADVKAALAARADGATVTVESIGLDGQTRTRTWTPADDAPRGVQPLTPL
ncbi:MAG: PDZ domain-containing protein [Planctomycetes bacterium]|nr:PDZ domain-containing protein [Planctomycetota bacterium]